MYVSRYFQTFSHHRHTQESTSTTSQENPSSLDAAIDEGFDELEDHEVLEQLSTDIVPDPIDLAPPTESEEGEVCFA